ncbi:MAG: hypothetical protein AB1485_08840, partial [Candidatus Thermoplasmatota archaeon]
SMAVRCENKKIKYFSDEIFKDYIQAGFTPVTFGDIVVDEKLGFCICSGDALMLELAKKFESEKAIFVMDVDGFYSNFQTADAKLLPELSTKTFDTVIKQTVPSKIPDVTGSALEKMRISLELARYTKTIVINGMVKNRLRAAIEGKSVIGTEVRL